MGVAQHRMMAFEIDAWLPQDLGCEFGCRLRAGPGEESGSGAGNHGTAVHLSVCYTKSRCSRWNLPPRSRVYYKGQSVG